MNKFGQIGMGLMILCAVALITGLVLYQSVGKTVGDVTTTVTAVNSTFTTAAAGATMDWPGCQRWVGTPYISNYSSAGNAVVQANFTSSNGLGTDSLISARITTAALSLYGGNLMNISYTCEPDGYIDSAGGRQVTLMIVIFAALGILVTALVPTLRNSVLSMMGV